MTVLLLALLAQAPEPPTVGMPARMRGVVLPGPELVPKPLDDRSPIVLRIEAVYPHGTARRYDFVYYGLEPGDFDLRDVLVPVAGEKAVPLPPLPVSVRPAYPVGERRTVRDLDPTPAPALGGYRLALAVAGGVWVVGLLAILRARRRRPESAAAPPPQTLEDRLRPLVRKAAEGGLSEAGQAELERLLLAFWRRRIPGGWTSLGDLRGHPEAGPLIRGLERWLHRPGGDPGLDVGELLRPYRGAS
ncbi:MAG TPA: hypothetical protein VEJ18_01015 [Planctomycetota bacterium]|nr:hypothetical protein [Planctomycetota bacterium]